MTAVKQDDVPDNLRAAGGEELLVQLHAESAQVYVCEVGQDGKKSWGLKRPEATLVDDGGQSRPQRTQFHGCFLRLRRNLEAESSGTSPQFSD